MPQTHRRSDCPVVFALDVFGDKWSLVIIRDMILEGKTTYNDFLNSDEGIATNILSERLRLLEEKGIIKKIPDERDRRRHVHILADRGLDLIPVLIDLIVWGSKHDPDAGPHDDFTKMAMRDRAGLIRKIRSGIKRGQYYCA